MPPPTGLAVNVTSCPIQIILLVAVIVTSAAMVCPTDMVMVFEVKGFPTAQVELLVICKPKTSLLLMLLVL